MTNFLEDWFLVEDFHDWPMQTLATEWAEAFGRDDERAWRECNRADIAFAIAGARSMSIRHALGYLLDVGREAAAGAPKPDRAALLRLLHTARGAVDTPREAASIYRAFIVLDRGTEKGLAREDELARRAASAFERVGPRIERMARARGGSEPDPEARGEELRLLVEAAEEDPALREHRKAFHALSAHRAKLHARDCALCAVRCVTSFGMYESPLDDDDAHALAMARKGQYFWAAQCIHQAGLAESFGAEPDSSWLGYLALAVDVASAPESDEPRPTHDQLHMLGHYEQAIATFERHHARVREAIETSDSAVAEDPWEEIRKSLPRLIAGLTTPEQEPTKQAAEAALAIASAVPVDRAALSRALREIEERMHAYFERRAMTAEDEVSRRRAEIRAHGVEDLMEKSAELHERFYAGREKPS